MSELERLRAIAEKARDTLVQPGEWYSVGDGRIDGKPEEDSHFIAAFSPDTALKLLAVASAAEELKLWEPGRQGYAAAQQRVFDALAALDTSGAQIGERA